ncbi:Oidioi.mRNA.OKI2018_I69.chr2.g6571.t1.cds [Oikopleura dioica]|uniref:Oidioi.mRNA.OKI2018_I69.chr2.g6571.t1.cds n=1 Tax=Oikopleura dioica TaxID=34765 RepID=A0ABN7T433_OIKDI|nr:Oidioi.mRNA.OKI2018_I69.chr2.g6571.t1.cds [Oikopleura dioica]
MLGLYSSHTVQKYPADCITSDSFPFGNDSIFVRSEYRQCKMLIGKYNDFPQPGSLTVLSNETFSSAFMFSYSTAIFSSFYDNDDAKVLDEADSEGNIKLPFLSHAGSRIYFLVITVENTSPFELIFDLPGAEIPSNIELLETRKAVQIFLPVLVIFLVMSVFICCHFHSSFRCTRNSRGIHAQDSSRSHENNATTSAQDWAVDLPPDYENFSQYPEAKLESLPPQYRADVDLPGYEASNNDAFQPPKYESSAVSRNQTT